LVEHEYRIQKELNEVSVSRFAPVSTREIPKGFCLKSLNSEIISLKRVRDYPDNSTEEESDKSVSWNALASVQLGTR
jgi:hypothetical protein